MSYIFQKLDNFSLIRIAILIYGEIIPISTSSASICVDTIVAAITARHTFLLTYIKIIFHSALWSHRRGIVIIGIVVIVAIGQAIVWTVAFDASLLLTLVTPVLGQIVKVAWVARMSRVNIG